MQAFHPSLLPSPKDYNNSSSRHRPTRRRRPRMRRRMMRRLRLIMS